MTSDNIYKIALCSQPELALLESARSVGLPAFLTKMAGVPAMAAKYLTRSAGRGATRAAAKTAPGIGKRIAQNWWMAPVGAAGVYGLGSMAGIGSGEAPEEMPPAQARHAQLLQLAQQYAGPYVGL